MSDIRTLRYGRPEPLPEGHWLRAGPISLLFENGMIRYVRVGGHDVLWGVYAAVRTETWATVPGVLSGLNLKTEADRFDLRFTSAHRQGPVDFVWQGRITGSAEGRVTFDFGGQAGSSFLRNRVGFCVLHPVTAAGQRVRITHPDGTTTEGHFPEAIAPHQPFTHIRRLSHEVAPGFWAHITCEGDIFETEDQRNWTDASFKTYCTLLDLPMPVEVKAGERLWQRITLELEGDIPAARVGTAPYRLECTGEAQPRPATGFGAGSAPLSERDLERLRGLRPDHLRLELDAATLDRALLEQKAAEARGLGCALWLALTLSDDPEAELDAFAKVLETLNIHPARVLVFRKGEGSTPEPVLEAAQRYLGDLPLAGGSAANFTELNRDRAVADTSHAVVYALNPQVHAFDNRSLVETLPLQQVTAQKARAFSGDKPLLVGPVTLGKRAAPPDARQASLFGAAWTLGSLKHLSLSPADALTYFEVAGPKGLMDGERVFPLYHALADVLEFGEIVPTRSSHPLQFEGVVLREGERVRAVLANFTGEPLEIVISGVDGRCQGRSLDDANADLALSAPEAWRASLPLSFDLGGDPSVTLPPYALLTLERA